MSPQDGLLLRTTRVPHKMSGDVSAKRAHTPKSASHTHDIPFRERMHSMISHIAQPVYRMAFGRMLAKLANYTKM